MHHLTTLMKKLASSKKEADVNMVALPSVALPAVPASAKNTPEGMVPPAATTQSKGGVPFYPDAGASTQKSQTPMGLMSLPKQAHVNFREESTMSISGRPLVQDLVKQAMSLDVHRAKIAAEAARQMSDDDDDDDDKKKKEKESCGMKTAGIPTEQVDKLASVIEWLIPNMDKISNDVSITDRPQMLPEGVTATNTKGTLPGPGGYGQAKHQIPMHSVMQSTTQVGNTHNDTPGGPGTQQLSISGGKGKLASSKSKKKEEAPDSALHNVTGYLLGGVPGALGAHYGGIKAHEAGAPPGEGALRGGVGSVLGSTVGALGGGGLGALAAGGPGLIAGGLGGGVLGGLGGYKLLTDKYNDKLAAANLAFVKAAAQEGPVEPVRVRKMIDAVEPVKVRKMLNINLPTQSNPRAYGTVVGKSAVKAKDAGKGMSGKAKALLGAGAAGLAGIAGLAAHRALSKDDKKGKKKSASVADYLLEYVKAAEDAINPAQISAGPTVPPETSAAGQPGGTPAGGAPQGPTGLVGSNDAAINYSRGQAYANRKQDLAPYLNEPALTSTTDKTLQEAFAHTSEAGTKVSSAQAAFQVSAARALLSKLAEATNEAAGQSR